jgi:hypothetical protein
MGTGRVLRHLVWTGILLLSAAGAKGSEMVTLNTPAGPLRGEVVKVTASEVVLRDVSGKERSVPAFMLKPREVYLCRKQVTGDEDAKARFELGEYCVKSNLKSEAETELRAAARLDAASYKDKAEALLKSAPAAETPKTAKAEPPKAEPAKADTAKKETAAKKDDTTKKDETASAEGPDSGEGTRVMEVRDQNGKLHRIRVKVEDVKPRSEEEMKKFLADELVALKKHCGGVPPRPGEKSRDWTLEETAHYYIFSNLKPEQKAAFKEECEKLYKFLAEVLEHKEGDPLWNNKCPIYFLANRTQFDNFVRNVEKGAGTTNAGGYFSHRGRDVHIVIPLYEWMNDKEAMRAAMNTLRHEGTHAFLQLAGKDVQINRWLHEGMAQFIEFWYDPVNNPDRNRRVGELREALKLGEVLSWEEGKDRPQGGDDNKGYGFAYTRVLFLFYSFLPDRRKLPKMIKLIKEGKTDEQALEEAFGKKAGELEKMWEGWLKENAKTNLRMPALPP